MRPAVWVRVLYPIPSPMGYVTDMTDQQKAELAALAAMSEDEIDTSDIPEVTDWSNAKRGVFYRMTKQQITLDLDTDVIAWFKSNAKTDIDSQTAINQVLREYVRRQIVAPAD